MNDLSIVIFIKEHPIFCAIILPGIFCLIPGMIWIDFIYYPFILTIFNIVYLVRKNRYDRNFDAERRIEYLTIILGLFFSKLFMWFALDNIYTKDWTETLYGYELHTPIYTKSILSVYVIIIIGFAGYLKITAKPIEEIPPLTIVTCMAAMYLGLGISLVWIIQFFQNYIILCVFPLNCFLIVFKVIKQKIWEWNTIQEYDKKNEVKYKIFFGWDRHLINSKYWIVAAFVLMWPLLGILICILALLGQHPGSLINAWTNTSDWTLSQKVSPPNIQSYD